jgi:hypothetical protein
MPLPQPKRQMKPALPPKKQTASRRKRLRPQKPRGLLQRKLTTTQVSNQPKKKSASGLVR